MTTGLWSVGSISTHVGNIIGWTNIPATLSGTTLNNIAEQSINRIENFVPVTIDSSAIPEKYQPCVIKLTQADLLRAIESSEGGVDSIKLGELSVSSGKGGHSDIATQLEKDAYELLKEINRTVKYKRVIGA